MTFFFCFFGEGLACFRGKEDFFLGERAKTWGKEEGSGGRVKKKKEIEKKETNGRKRGKRRRKRGEGGDDSRGRR